MLLNKLCICLLLLAGISCKNISPNEAFFVVINPVTTNHLEVRLVPKGNGKSLLSRSGYCTLTIDGDENIPSFTSSSVGKIYSTGSGEVYELYQCIPSKDRVPKYFSHGSKISYLDEMIIKPDFKSEKGKYKFNLRLVCSVINIDKSYDHSFDSKTLITNFSINESELKKNERIIIDPDWQ